MEDFASKAERTQAAHEGMYTGSEHDACGVGCVANIKGIKSHQVVQSGLKVLENLDHRGAVGADPLMGDGSGILIQIPDGFLRAEMAKESIILPELGRYGVGMIFLPKDEQAQKLCLRQIELAIAEQKQKLIGWRRVPVNSEMPMAKAVRATEPVIYQVFIAASKDIADQSEFERKLYVIRKLAASNIESLNSESCQEYYVASMSSSTIVYKGLLLANQLGAYYTDLQDCRLVSALALVHQRFSTNTFPAWSLAHPYRLVAHNGEINTIKGNFNWMRARQGVMQSEILGTDLAKTYPISKSAQSDTAVFDNTLELLVMAGYPLAQAVMMMIPQAWEKNQFLDSSHKAFYEYHASVIEPWDGPAAMIFTDGKLVGATLDRNGLRPIRYMLTDDDLAILASEAGVLPIPENRIIKKWRLQPGKMFLIDLAQGRVIEDQEIKDLYTKGKPYINLVESNRINLKDIEAAEPRFEFKASLLERQRAFGYNSEDIKFHILPMAMQGQESIGSMGDDTPLAALSNKTKPLYNYFRQIFAQVTNPPIDPIREEAVMSLVTFLGTRPDLLDIKAKKASYHLEIKQPVLDYADMARIRNLEQSSQGKLKIGEIDITYPVLTGYKAIEKNLISICLNAQKIVESGASILIITDHNLDKDHLAIPAILALSAIHQHLIKQGLRTKVGLVVETGSVCEVHHFAVLAGFGAEAIHPYLALETITDLLPKIKLPQATAISNYIKAVGKGLLKTMSKMGISTYQSYCAAQMFEAIGLDKGLIDKYFTGTPTQISGVDIFTISQQIYDQHIQAFNTDTNIHALADHGDYAWRVDAEEHMWQPDAIAKLQHSVRSNDFSIYKEYAELINNQATRLMTIRGLFEFKTEQCTTIPLAEVEAASQIVKRFATGAMSLGSISTEAHLNLAIAMNRLGGKSNTGEGGEDPARYRNYLLGDTISAGTTLSEIIGKGEINVDYALHQGDSLRSKIKQVASGRFGVTTEYLVSAEQIQIKIAQGAKPGEGGQLPGKKVSNYIGRLRNSLAGVGLISPPPHHDIYSIEDLAQLIHDLKSVNPQADISVKLVSEFGVGTIAAGVVKAKADHLVIAGYDGGTGASPLSSIKHAGSAWELGLAETQQTLVLNRLRDRVRIQVDGQIKTGRDVVIGALLGADEFGFATAPLVASGCVMMRKCHLNTCPTGIATQNPELRKKFTGAPEHIVNFFFFIAEEVRLIMAQLGIRNFEDLIGRIDLINSTKAISNWKAKGLNLSKIFAQVSAPDIPNSHKKLQDHGLEKELDVSLIVQALPAIEQQKRVCFKSPIRNVNRSVGAGLSGALIKKHPKGLADDSIKIQFIGTGGQSFGAFLAKGITFDLVGQANDYVGKGLSGACLIVRPDNTFKTQNPDNIIVGNTVLYGATSGQAYLSGVAGERFAVRMSGATAVVEGTGDHGCEYMTGGTVVVLGNTGINFAAGMSGGVAYVYDEDEKFTQRCNLALVSLQEVLTEAEQIAAGIPLHAAQSDEQNLKQLIQKHWQYTESSKAKAILDNWSESRNKFVKVFPIEYAHALKKQSKFQQDPINLSLA